MFLIVFNTDNAAFEGDLMRDEVASILRRIADQVEHHGPWYGPVRDTNGNRVGSWTYEPGASAEDNPFHPESPEGRAWERGEREE